jgi:hypothetical protein
MPDESAPVACISSANALRTADDGAQPGLVLRLMRELEASLDASRKVLLALDLAGIERETREQVELTRKLEAVLQPGAARPVHGTGPAHCAGPAHGRRPAEEALFWSADSPELEEEFRRCYSRILEATRLQAALLARAQSKLRVLANMLAGRSINYGPLVARNGVPRVFGWKPGGEI